MTGGGGSPRQSLSLGAHADAVGERLAAWRRSDFGARLLRRDWTLWSAQPLPELGERLGWIDLPERTAAAVEELTQFAAEVVADGVQKVLLLGMGGSSLAPEVFQQVLGPAPGCPPLAILDSTHPEAVAERLASHPPETTLYLLSSKSGTTVETLSFFRTFWAEAEARLAQPGERFVAITDPGSPLAALAAERGFRRTFAGDPEVGGRFSALSPFGMVPAALLGLDLRRLLAGAAAAASAPESALDLGAALGELALAGRDKLTLVTDQTLRALPAWIEQLVAESLGKEGRGVVPVVDEPPQRAAGYGPDRCFVSLTTAAGTEVHRRLAELAAAGHPTVAVTLDDPYDLGAEMMRWEIATAAAGAVLGVNPFDQPDVELAKQLAREVLRGGGEEGRDMPAVVEAEALGRVDLEELVAVAEPGDYAALQAFLPAMAETEIALASLRERLLARGLATTAGFGPRYLHSTGQLHKGGPASGLFLQVLDRPRTDLAIPETGSSYGALIAAQAAGDARALARRGRRLWRVELVS